METLNRRDAAAAAAAARASAGSPGASAAAAASSSSSTVFPAPPVAECRLLQMWGLLREMCALGAPLHPLTRVRLYMALCSAGLLRALSGALETPSGSYGGGAALGEAHTALQVRDRGSHSISARWT